jgi:hypothetical protein
MNTWVARTYINMEFPVFSACKYYPKAGKLFVIMIGVYIDISEVVRNDC